MNPFNDKPIEGPDESEVKRTIANSQNQETAPFFGMVALLHHWRMLNLFLGLMHRDNYINYTDYTKVSCGLIHETHEEAKERSMQSLYREIYFHYCIIIEECIKVIFSLERKFLKLDSNGRRVFDNSELSHINNLKIDKRYSHKIHKYFKQLTPETQKLICTEYESMASEYKEIIKHDNVKHDKVEIAAFNTSLDVNEEIIKNIKYNFKLPEKPLPCGVLYHKDSDKLYVFLDNKYNFSYFLLKLIYEQPNSWIDILRDKYSV